jgi:hypothetical protein
MKVPPAGGDIGGQVRAVAAGEVDGPAGCEQATGGRAADQTGPADDQRTRHRRHANRGAAAQLASTKARELRGRRSTV